MGIMTRRFGLLLACVAGLGIGCKDKDGPPRMDAGPDSTLQDGATDGDVDGDVIILPTCPTEPGDRDAYFLISRIGFDRNIVFDGPAIAGGEAVGFDIDGVVGMTCNHVDFVWESVPGIDNNMAPLMDLAGQLFDMDVDALLQDSIVSGDVLILARVSAWNGTANDGCVDLALLLGVLPEDAPEDYVGSCVGEGEERVCTVNPDLEIELSQLSFDAEGNPLIFRNQQEVIGGRIHTDPFRIQLDVPFGDGASLSLVLQDAMVRIDITDESLSNGILGGVLDADALVDALLSTGLVPPEFESLVGDVIRSLGDIHTRRGDCKGISIGMAVDGVPAVATGVALCELNRDCNDGNPCTTNVCGSDGTCESYNVDPEEPCGTDGMCNGTGRCVECLSATDCDPAQPFCSSEGECVECLDSTDCDPEMHCNPIGLCVECLDATHCDDDAIDCTDKACISGTCGQVPVHERCDDGVGCTNDSCDVTSGCVFMPDAANCADGNECTLTPCDPVEDCQVMNVTDGSTCPGGTCQGGVCTP
jgi:hypothetical protein